jgi:signal transduction histidine kinase
MEAVGQLTGGIAHDFNNLLTIILGNLDTLERRIAKPDVANEIGQFARTLRRPVEAALHGARRAAQLTQRLLAFARRQKLAPMKVDCNRLIGNMTDLPNRKLGEQITVETVAADGLWPTLADENQIESAILNLAVNARDAMPQGGKLTIETANASIDEAYAAQFADVSQGQYVMISISDTGTGIPPDLIDRVLEPSFCD